MLHPNQFEVNEAWIAFQLSDAPIRTDVDGEFQVVALMDAASCFILASGFRAAARKEPTRAEVRRMMETARAHKQQWPRTLFVPKDLPARGLTAVADQHGIAVIPVEADHLILFVAEAQQGFRERFGPLAGH